MKTVVSLSLLVFSFGFAFSARALSIEDAAAAAKAAGFEDKAFPKSGDSYVTSKSRSKGNTVVFKTFAKSKTSAVVDQITLSCNQCESKKISEANSILCFEDVQTIAQKLKVDLPGGVIKAFENVKSQQQAWDLNEKSAKSLRYTKTQVKCPKVSSEGIKFDFFFK